MENKWKVTLGVFINITKKGEAWIANGFKISKKNITFKKLYLNSGIDY